MWVEVSGGESADIDRVRRNEAHGGLEEGGGRECSNPFQALAVRSLMVSAKQ